MPSHEITGFSPIKFFTALIEATEIIMNPLTRIQRRRITNENRDRRRKRIDGTRTLKRTGLSIGHWSAIFLPPGDGKSYFLTVLETILPRHMWIHDRSRWSVHFLIAHFSEYGKSFRKITDQTNG